MGANSDGEGGSPCLFGVGPAVEARGGMPKREFTALEINLNCVYRLFSADLTAYSNVFLPLTLLRERFSRHFPSFRPPFTRSSPAFQPPFKTHLHNV